MNRPLRAVVAVLLATLALAACTSGKHQPAAPTTIPSDVTRAAFLSAVRTAWPDADEARLVDMGHTICDRFASGGTWLEAVAMLTDGTSVDGYAAGSLIGGAVAAFCPQFESLPHDR